MRGVISNLKRASASARDAISNLKRGLANARDAISNLKRGLASARDVISNLKRGLRHLQPLNEGLQLTRLLVFPRDVQVLLQSLLALRDGGGGDVAESSDLLVFAEAHAQEAAEFDLRLA